VDMAELLVEKKTDLKLLMAAIVDVSQTTF